MIPLDPPRSAFLEKAATARVLPISCEIVADSDLQKSYKLSCSYPFYFLDIA